MCEHCYLGGLAYSAVANPCGCSDYCGDDGDIDGPGTCKGLPIRREPLVEIVMVPRSSAPPNKHARTED